MNQIRNLIFFILFNVISVTLLPYLFLKLTGLGFATPNIILTTIVIHFLGFVITGLCSSADTTTLFPPIGLYFLLSFFISTLRGNVKMIRTVDYKFFSRFKNGKIHVYDFEMLFRTKIINIEFQSSEHTTRRIKEMLYSHLKTDLYVYNNSQDFKKWDGSLDEQSRRINTIKKITQ